MSVPDKKVVPSAEQRRPAQLPVYGYGLKKKIVASRVLPGELGVGTDPVDVRLSEAKVPSSWRMLYYPLWRKKTPHLPMCLLNHLCIETVSFTGCFRKICQ